MTHKIEVKSSWPTPGYSHPTVLKDIFNWIEENNISLDKRRPYVPRV